MNSELDSNLEAMDNTPRYVDWIVDQFNPYLLGRIAEIGAGIGTISERIVNKVSSLDLIEPSVSFAETLRVRFKDNDKISVISMMLENYMSDHQPDHYDTIVMVYVLEHIENDRATLNLLNSSIRAGGHLLIYVPALPFLYSKLDELVGHYRRYLRAELTNKLKEAGFKIKYDSDIDFLGIFSWYVFNTMGGKTSLSSSAVQLYDRIGVPITRFGERQITPPVGKNIIVVAEKPV